MPEEIAELFRVIFLLLGISFCFYGWGMYKGLIKFIGGVIGFLIGLMIGVALTWNMQSTCWQGCPEVGITVLIIACASAWIMAELMWAFVRAAVFIMGAFAGIFLSKILFLSYAFGNPKYFLSIFSISPTDIIFAIILGIVALWLHKFIIIGFTSVLGAFLISVAYGFGWFFPLIIVGALVQYGTMQWLGVKVEDILEKEKEMDVGERVLKRLKGEKIEATPKVQPASPTPQPKTFCTKCGFPLKSGVKFCTSCGKPRTFVQTTSAPQKSCTYCGATLKVGIKFCTSCGKRIQGN